MSCLGDGQTLLSKTPTRVSPLARIDPACLHLQARSPRPLPPPPSPFRFLRNRLKQTNDAAVKNLSSLRALYRLSLASGDGAGILGGGRGLTDGVEGGTGAAGAAADPHPHITALATVLGEGSKLMVRLAESSLGDGVMEPVAELLHKDSTAQVSGGGGVDSYHEYLGRCERYKRYCVKCCVGSSEQTSLRCVCVPHGGSQVRV